MGLEDPPIGLLAELSHRCPLRCGYCSNPLALVGASQELETQEWISVFEQAARLGVLQLHLSGGEPCLRDDLERLVGVARELDLYTNLITSGARLDRGRLEALDAAGLDHIQLSFQDTRAESADEIAGSKGAYAKKLEVAAWIGETDIPLTVNAVLHRRNIERTESFVELALTLGATRLELANVQYHGWARRNFDALLPSEAQLEACRRVADAARDRLVGRLQIDFVPPDYYARRPKACMQGWGRRFLTVSPAGFVMPCHAADTIAGMRFDSVRERPLADIWQGSEAFERFRGTSWMAEPCRSCPEREQDFGGCRCQAMAIVGRPEATDPVCEYSPDRPLVDRRIEQAMGRRDAPILLRGAAPRRPESP